MAGKTADSLETLWRSLRAATVTHVDETSWWVGGRPRWLWVFTTPAQTLYRIAKGRGREVVLETLGVDYAGVLVSDCLASYENLPYRMQKYYAHHLKAIAEARDRAPPESRGEFDALARLSQIEKKRCDFSALALASRRFSIAKPL